MIYTINSNYHLNFFHHKVFQTFIIISSTKIYFHLNVSTIQHSQLFTGHAGWRRCDDGAWFIKCLVDTFLSVSLERISLTKALTMVSGAVSRLQSKCGKKQVPCLVSKLIKDIYFTSKKVHS